MRWRNNLTFVKQGAPAISLHVPDNPGYQGWRESSCGTALVFLHGHTHTKQAHTYTSENAEQTEPTHPRGHGPTRACSYVQMDPKSVWNVSGASYLAADNDTHQLWTVSSSSWTFLHTHNHHIHTYKRKRVTVTVPSFSASPKPVTSSIQ